MVVRMTMTMIPVTLEFDGDSVAHALQEAREKLDGNGSDLCLDFSSVRRIDPSALQAMEELAGLADEKSVGIKLRGVNVDIYRVLKLMKLSQRFTFLN
jgi:anti-anti-sigma regulatory factor